MAVSGSQRAATKAPVACIRNRDQSPFLNILSNQRVSETLRLMGRSPSGRITLDTAREICERTGSAAVLAGSINSLGSQSVVGLNAVNCASGDSLARDETQAPRKEEVLNALGKATTRIRDKLGESLASIQKFDAPIEQATTSSLEALKAYSLGFRTMGTVGSTQAFELRDRVSEKEKLNISSRYYWMVLGDLEQELHTYQVWERTYPRDAEPHYVLYRLAFLGDDLTGMESQVAVISGIPSEGDFLNEQSKTEASFGRLRKAREISRRAAEAAKRAALTETVAFREALVALREAEFGNSQMARRAALADLAASTGRGPKTILSMVFARSETQLMRKRSLANWINGFRRTPCSRGIGRRRFEVPSNLPERTLLEH